MNYAHRIIEELGGVRKTAAATGVSPSGVQGWKRRGSIPDDQKPKVLAAAAKMGVNLTPKDFWPGAAA